MRPFLFFLFPGMRKQRRGEKKEKIGMNLVRGKRKKKRRPDIMLLIYLYFGRPISGGGKAAERR